MNIGIYLRNILAAIGVAAAICGTAQAETLRIGVIGAMTGGGAAWGLAEEQGYKIAADEANAQGGLEVGGKKYQVEIIAYDDQYKASSAMAAYNRAVNENGAKYVVLMSSAGALAVKQNVEDDKIISFTSAYSAKAIDSNTKYMFRLFSVASDYTPGLIDWISNNIKQRRVVIINPNDETGWDQSRLTDKLFKDKGFEVLGNELYERDQKDFQPFFTKLLALKPDVMDLGSSSPATAGLLIRQARELGYKGLFLKTGGAGPEEIVAVAGKEAAEGMISVLYADPANPGYKKLVDAYQKAKGQSPNAIIVPFYDSAKVLLAAIQKAGDPKDTAKVAAAVAQVLPMKSVLGDELTLAGGGRQIATTMYIGEIRNGVPIAVGSAK